MLNQSTANVIGEKRIPLSWTTGFINKTTNIAAIKKLAELSQSSMKSWDGSANRRSLNLLHPAPISACNMFPAIIPIGMVAWDSAAACGGWPMTLRSVVSTSLRVLRQNKLNLLAVTKSETLQAMLWWVASQCNQSGTHCRHSSSLRASRGTKPEALKNNNSAKPPLSTHVMNQNFVPKGTWNHRSGWWAGENLLRLTYGLYPSRWRM